MKPFLFFDSPEKYFIMDGRDKSDDVPVVWSTVSPLRPPAPGSGSNELRTSCWCPASSVSARTRSEINVLEWTPLNNREINVLEWTPQNNSKTRYVNLAVKWFHLTDLTMLCFTPKYAMLYPSTPQKHSVVFWATFQTWYPSFASQRSFLCKTNKLGHK